MKEPMSDNNEFGSQKSLAVVVKEDNPSFLRDEIALKKLLKDLTKASKEAIEVLVVCLKSEDEKIRMQAASKILEFQSTVADKVNQDQMQRLVAEIKFNRQPQGKLMQLEDEKPATVRPVVDFTRIREVD
jgi:hypothetical protein